MMGRPLSTVLSLLILTNCGELPQAKWEQLKKLRISLRSHAAAPYLPESLQRFDSRYWQLREARSSAWGWSLLPWEKRLLEERLDLCIGWAQILLRQANKQLDSVREHQKQALDAVELRLLEARMRRLDPDLRRLLTATQLKLEEAKQQWLKQNFIQVDSLNRQLVDSYEAIESHLLTTEERFADPVLRRLWDEWVQETIRLSTASGATALVIDKQRRLLKVYRSGRPQGAYPVDLGRNSVADKLHQGDGATPEGLYKVLKKKGPGTTRYFRALLLDYPNQRDRQLFREARVKGHIEPNVGIGNLIEIHGEGGRGKDWTDGCVALSNEHMQELFQMAYPGMPITIVGASSD